MAIKNSIAVKEKFPQANVSVLHNDIEVYGVIQEEWYKLARAMGIRFRMYSPGRRPEVPGDGGRLNVKRLGPMDRSPLRYKESERSPV